jgi:uncharacterized protein YbjQ (UPF0145 family)
LNKASFKAACLMAPAVFLLISANAPIQVLAKSEKWTPETISTPPPILVTTTLSVEGHPIREYKGVVRGVTVRTPTIVQGWKADLKNIVGGKIGPFISMCETARQQAFDIMIQRAQEMGATAIVGMRYDSSAFGEGDDMGTEVVCYGTAVVLEGTTVAPTKQADRSQTPLLQVAEVDE